MKKARIIKIIKSGSDQPAEVAARPVENPPVKYEKRRSVKVVEGWVSEYHEQKLLAEQVALSLLYDSAHKDKSKKIFKP